MNKFAFILLLLLLIVSCGFPNESIVTEEFERIASKEIPQELQIIDLTVTTGEGDSDNVYKHVKFGLISKKDLTINEGWLSGKSIQQDQMLHGGEVVILYQQQKGKWLAKSHSVIRIPQ